MFYNFLLSFISMKAISSMLKKKKKKLALTRDPAVLFLVEIGISFSNNEVKEEFKFMAI